MYDSADERKDPQRLTEAIGHRRDNARPVPTALLNPLFELFDFYEPGDAGYDEIVPAFVSGQVV